MDISSYMCYVNMGDLQMKSILMIYSFDELAEFNLQMQQNSD